MYKIIIILKVLITAILKNPIKVLNQLFLRNNYEEFSPQELKEIIGNYPGLVIEAGAWNGDDTYKLSRIFDDSIICGVEPIPEMYDLLSDRFRGNEKIKLYNNALSGNSKIVKLYYGSDLNPSGSLNKVDLHNKIFKTLFDKEVSITSVTVDSIMEDYPNLMVNLLWLDIQGSELEVIKSISQSKLKRIRFIHTEISHLNLYENQPTKNDFFEYMESVGFRCVISRHPLFSGNYIFRNSQLTSS
jgi:FkbM family methyltransferase